MNSFIGWIGGKRVLRNEILQRMPSGIGRYIEVFGGAGWVLFGRETCIARRPKCADCFISDLCPSCPKDLIGNRGNPQE